MRGADVARYADLRLQEGAAPATINRELAALRAAYRLGMRNDVIASMPDIAAMPENKTRTGFFERPQFEAVCRQLPADLADVAKFCYLTGWRSKREVFPLTWPQVDWSGWIRAA